MKIVTGLDQEALDSLAPRIKELVCIIGDDPTVEFILDELVLELKAMSEEVLEGMRIKPATQNIEITDLTSEEKYNKRTPQDVTGYIIRSKRNRRNVLQR